MERAAIAISGGADSVYLLYRHLESLGPNDPRPLLLHVNHLLRGEESDADQRFVEQLARDLGLPLRVGRAPAEERGRASGIEDAARRIRYRFLRTESGKEGIRRILVAHTADDQVETVLMRVFEGAGLSGLKGIPVRGEEGVERPLLGTWRSGIRSYLEARGLPFRSDSSNLDTRFERNWVRLVLLPLLVERYGDSVKGRILALGERFRELDAFVSGTAARWIRRNVKGFPPAFRRKGFSRLPAPVRIRILQELSLEHVGKSPNERLLASLDRSIREGMPSASVSGGAGIRFRNRYEFVEILPEDRERRNRSFLDPIAVPLGIPGRASLQGPVPLGIRAEVVPPRAFRKEEAGTDEMTAWFDLELLDSPLSVRALERGDRVAPLGGRGSRKVKEVLIDRKVPAEERWGRAVVVDASGSILWIPGVIRSRFAPVVAATRQVVRLTARSL